MIGFKLSERKVFNFTPKNDYSFYIYIYTFSIRLQTAYYFYTLLNVINSWIGRDIFFSIMYYEYIHVYTRIYT